MAAKTFTNLGGKVVFTFNSGGPPPLRIAAGESVVTGNLEVQSALKNSGLFKEVKSVVPKKVWKKEEEE